MSFLEENIPTSTEIEQELQNLPLELSLAALQNYVTIASAHITPAEELLGLLDASDDIQWALQRKTDSLTALKHANAIATIIHTLIRFLNSLIGNHKMDISYCEKLENQMVQLNSLNTSWQQLVLQANKLVWQRQLAGEWIELSEEVIEEIQEELEACQLIAFQIEETRHQYFTEFLSIEKITIIFNEIQGNAQLKQLTTRLQPLKVSLDFLHPRLALFEDRASQTFPTAIAALKSRHLELLEIWNNLQLNIEEIKQEFKDDQWVDIFRNVSKRATETMDTIERSLKRLQSNLADSPNPRSKQIFDPVKVKKFEETRDAYSPAIINVLSIIGKGISERRTTNGEVSRLYSAMQHRWARLEDEIIIMNARLSSFPKSNGADNVSKCCKTYDITTTTPTPRRLSFSSISHVNPSISSLKLPAAKSNRGSISHVPMPTPRRKFTCKTGDSVLNLPLKSKYKRISTQEVENACNLRQKQSSVIPQSTPSRLISSSKTAPSLKGRRSLAAFPQTRNISSPNPHFPRPASSAETFNEDTPTSEFRRSHRESMLPRPSLGNTVRLSMPFNRQ